MTLDLPLSVHNKKACPAIVNNSQEAISYSSSSRRSDFGGGRAGFSHKSMETSIFLITAWSSITISKNLPFCFVYLNQVAMCMDFFSLVCKSNRKHSGLRTGFSLFSGLFTSSFNVGLRFLYRLLIAFQCSSYSPMLYP